jgi:hypothetical protein
MKTRGGVKVWHSGSWPRYYMEVSGQLHGPAALTPGKATPLPWGPAGWVRPRADLDAMQQRTISCRESNTGSWASSPALYRLSYPGYRPRNIVYNIQTYKACTVFARSEAGIVGSNPTQGMAVYVCAFFCVCVQVEALRRADHPPKKSYRLSKI